MSELLERYQEVLCSIEADGVNYSDKAFRNDNDALDTVLYDAAWDKHFYDRECLKLAIKKEEEAIMLARARVLSSEHERSAKA